MNDCPFRYQGQYQDEETGLYYNRFRYYDPNVGNYISKDPIGLAGGNPTLYGYVHDTNGWVDRLGLDEGIAIIRQWENGHPEGHFSIEIQTNIGQNIDTHQVGYGQGQTRWGYPEKTKIITTQQMPAGSNLYKEVIIELPDADAALRKQMELLQIDNLGEYFPTKNSCLTHVMDVLEAGGEDVEINRKGMEKFANKYGFEHH